jgi:hypothetical protein
MTRGIAKFAALCKRVRVRALSKTGVI